MFKQALIMDIPFDIFWYKDPHIYWIYVSAYIEKEKMKTNRINEEAWLQGIYIQNAIASAFDGKKYKYPEKPLELNKMEDTEELTEKQQEEIRAETYRKLKNWSTGLKGKFSKDTN